MSTILNRVSDKTFLALDNGNLVCVIAFTDEPLPTLDMVEKLLAEVKEEIWLEQRRRQDEELFMAGQEAGKETIRRMEEGQ